MFCENCKKEVDNDAKFCPFCGESIINSKENEQILFTLKPIFLVNRRTLAISIPIYLFLAAFPAIIFGYLSFIFTPIFIHFALRGYYELKSYNFYPDRLESVSNFIAKQLTTLKYKNIIATELKKGIIQQDYNLGTIVLSTGRMDLGGIMMISDIPNPDKNYEKILELINKAK